MLSQNFKDILDKFEGVRSENFKGHPFAHKIRHEFKDEIAEYVKTFTEKGVYRFKGYPGTSNWAKDYPQFRIGNKNSSRTFERGLYLFYSIDPKNRCLYLSLGQGDNEPDFDIRLEIAEKLIDAIGSDIPVGFITEYSEGKLHEDAVMSKYYEYDDLDETNVKEDLKKAISILEQIIPEYLNIIKEMELTSLINDINNTKEKPKENNAEEKNLNAESDDNEISDTKNKGKEDVDYNFHDYLISRGYFFDKRTIENYLLSLKVKPFAILTGNSGTGKTKLSQLFAEYCLLYKSFLKLDGDEGFVTIQVSTTESSYNDIDNQGRKINPGWTPRHEKLKEFLSLDKILGEYEIQLGNISKNATILLSTRLFYERDCIEFKEHFKSIFDTGDVYLKISNEDIISCINPFFNYLDEFKIYLNLPNDVDTFDGRQLLPTEFLQYVPLKEGKFKIYTEDFKHHANANIRFEFRINFDNDDETKEYLKSINGDKYELTIKGFKNNFYELCEIVPVGANWTENRNVVGYYNVLTKEYQHTPSLDLILKAQEHTDEPYFLILDEMNLSHVERYFSDFLSSMESQEPIPLHNADDVAGVVPKELAIPNNVFIVGTVNVDETTYMFSPKVLDRANVIEFKTFEELSITDYIFNASSKFEFDGDVDYLENPLSDMHLRKNILSEINGGFNQVRHTLEVFKPDGEAYGLFNEESNLLDYIIGELSKFNGYLAGSGFEFGYRTVNEILTFMFVAWKYEGEQEVWDNWRRYFDAQILQKMLPKLHGSQMVLSETLDNLLAHCLGVEGIEEIDDLSEMDLGELDVPYFESSKKLIQLKNILEKQRYVSFIG